MLKNDMQSIEVYKIWVAHRQLIHCKRIVSIPHVIHISMYKKPALFLE